MSDTENPPDNPVVDFSAPGTPTPKTTPKGRGRGRGRRGPGAKKAAVATAGTANTAPANNATMAPRKAAGGRRGRTKQFDDDAIQAKYERQREIKSCFVELAALIKPALIDLAERETETLKNDPEYYRKQDEYRRIMAQLQSTMELRIKQADNRLVFEKKAHQRVCEADIYVNNAAFKNAFDDAEDAFLDATIRRLELLEDLYTNGRPVDEIDDSWRYKKITNEEADEMGPLREYHNGYLVPYPLRVEGTKGYERNLAKLRTLSQPAQPQAPPKVQPKRKAKDQPDGQPGPKKADNGAETPALTIAPAKHTQSLLSAQPTAMVEEEPSNESTPVPEGNLLPREREPALPSHVSEPDPYGVRSVNKPIPKMDPEKTGPANRFIVPNWMNLEADEIGFRDSTNDRTRGVTVAKRGKYLDTNDSATLHYDPMVARHHAGLLTEEDFDQDVVERHQVHPRYGFFLARSKNDAEPPKDHVEGHNTTVYITPDGRTIHANRTIPGYKITEANTESERQRAMKKALAETIEKRGIRQEEIETPEIDDLRKIHAAIVEQREAAAASLPAFAEGSETLDASRVSDYLPLNGSISNSQGLTSLLEAASAAEVPVATPAPVAATPARAVTRSYDAIRDMVIEHTPSEPAPAEPVTMRPPEDRTGLNTLADALLGQPFWIPPLGKRFREDDFLSSEAPPVKRPSLGMIFDSAPVQPIDPAMRPFAEDGRRDGSIAPLGPIEESSERMTLPPVLDPSMRPGMPSGDDPLRSSHLQGIPPVQPMEASHPYSHRRSLSGSFFGERSEHPIHRDIPPARPMEMASIRESDPRGYHADPYSSAFGRSQSSYQSSSRPPPSSRMPFSNPNPGHASPSLPPLRPGQPYGETTNGYFGQSPARMSADSPYMPLQPAPIHPGGSYSTMPPGHGPSQYGASLTSPYPPIAPSPSGLNSPPMSFSHHPLGGPELMSRGNPGSASSTPNNKIYRELAPAPLPPHRQGQHHSQELRTINYVPGDNIKDYTPTEQLPARGPQMVRSWNQYSHKNKLNMGQDRRGSN